MLVMKFGGASVARPLQFARIAKIVQKKLEQFPRIVICVSAMGATTDRLIALSKKVNPEPSAREMDMLLSSGERVSAALLAMALARVNVEAVSLTGSQSGIITDADHLNARIIDVRPFRAQELLEKGQVVIIAGFQGVSLNKEITTLGRGGSDTTAVAIGVALKADHVEFYKDVQGIYEADPRIHKGAELKTELTYESAVAIAQKGGVLEPRSILLAQKNSIPLHVLSFKKGKKSLGSWIRAKGENVRPQPQFE